MVRNLNGPSPENKEPMRGFPQVGYLKNYISSENIIVGDYTYYDDPEGPSRFESNVLYHFPFIGDKLRIGRFCAVAKDVKFIMNGAIIASKSVVTADVPAYSVVGGNPAEIIKYRFDDSTVDELLQVAWWDWTAEKITQHLEAIVGCDLVALRKASDS